MTILINVTVPLLDPPNRCTPHLLKFGTCPDGQFLFILKGDLINWNHLLKLYLGHQVTNIVSLMPF